ncbi:DUF6890 family protein [Vibrio lamellibrachiae]|uniref:DUF6890 family protein n=1 Tax=Vibrio lamellibrachiae TaxID=2910253 RepID=UPI003D123BAB
MEQAFTLRRYYLPHEDDDLQNLARAVWLDKREQKRMEVAVQNAVGNLFSSK